MTSCSSKYMNSNQAIGSSDYDGYRNDKSCDKQGPISYPQDTFPKARRFFCEFVHRRMIILFNLCVVCDHLSDNIYTNIPQTLSRCIHQRGNHNLCPSTCVCLLYRIDPCLKPNGLCTSIWHTSLVNKQHISVHTFKTSWRVSNLMKITKYAMCTMCTMWGLHHRVVMHWHLHSSLLVMTR